MECIPTCGACCIAPSISSLNKPAGTRCEHLSNDNLCNLFNKKERPKVCSDFKACQWICGQGAESALTILTALEIETQ